MEMMLFQLVQHLAPYAVVHVVGPYGGSSDDGGDNVIRPRRDGLLWFVLHGLFSSVCLLRKNSYDVILAGSALTVPIACLLGWLFRLPVTANVYGLDLIYPHPIYQWIVRMFLPQCHCVVAISQMAMEAAVERGVARERVSIIHPGIEFSEFTVMPELDVIRQAYDLDDRLVLLSVGRLARRKGVLEFVRYSLPDIVEKHPGVLFLVVGGNPELSLTHKENLEALIQDEVTQLGLEQNVRLLGWVDGGILVEPGAWDELSSIIIDLLSNEALRQEMGFLGRERAKTQFDWSVVARQFAELLVNL
jgi:phosphatidylinositol alpha-1,6-mannosyltransferase